MKEVKHKLISVVVAIVLIVLIIIVAFGKQIKTSMDNGEEINGRWFLALVYPDKYAYSNETADLNEYFELFSQDDVAIILGDERLDERGTMKDGHVYFLLSTAEKLFTDRFYFNEVEENLLYTTADSIYNVDLNGDKNGYTYAGAFTSTDYKPAFIKGEDVYVALDYVKMFANFEYAYFSDPHRVQVFNSWGTYKESELVKDTKLRYQGGVKSKVLTSLTKGQKVRVLEVMESWTKIRTEDGFAGYVENDKLSDAVEASRTPVTGAYDPYSDYQSISLGENVKLAWHQILFADDGAHLNENLPENSGINVVSPTWFYLNSEEGTFDNYATSAYVANAHAKGYQVWGLVEDMTNKSKFDEYTLFSSTKNRQALIENLISAVTSVGADGINVDCETISKQTGPHFVQFLRELSIETRKNGLILSVDNYVQNQGNLYYDLTEQGIVADYVIIMGYDEHWAGSEPGSVASIGFVESGIQAALEEGVASSKLINGVPFYTRLWKTEGANQSSETIGMDVAQAWIDNRGLTPSWNDEACQYYIKFEDGTAVYQMWLEDKESLGAKLSVMSTYGLAGVAGWRVGLENASAWEVINEYY